MKAVSFLKALLFSAIAMVCCLAASPAAARQMYGFDIPDAAIDSTAQHILAKRKNSAAILKGPQATTITAVMKAIPHPYDNRAFDFFLVLVLIAILAAIRAVNQQYVRQLFKAFSNPVLSTRQLKEQLQNNTGANLGMNLFVCLSLAGYGFYVLKYLTHNNKTIQSISPFVVLTSIVLVIVIVYSLRYLSLRFVGWIFNIEGIAENYTFNIFLVNKILSVILLPFTMILAWGTGQWVQVALFLSFIIIALSVLNRYARSGSSLKTFLQYSRFHFFLYLCAFEILPIAVIWKIINDWVIH